MNFDIFTTMTASCAVTFLHGLILVFFWRRNAGDRWLAWWALAFCTIGGANVLLTIKASLPDILSEGVATSMFILGFSLVWVSARSFEGRKPRVWPIALALAAWAVLFLVPGVRGNSAVRIAIMSLPMAGALALAAWEFWRGRAEGLPSKRIIALMLAAVAVLFALRVPLSPFAPYPFGGGPTDALVVIGFDGSLVAVSIAITVLLISMNLERSEQGHRRLALTDPLTGMLNRRGLDLALENGKLPVGASLVLFDLDRFKLINDTFGHMAGDALIASFAEICREELHQIDHAVRLGGEEFALVLLRKGERSARALAERIRERFAQTVVMIEGGAVAGTASGGVFSPPPDGAVWLNNAIAAADRALYRAKTAGRNRIFVESWIAQRPDDADCEQPAVAASA